MSPPNSIKPKKVRTGAPMSFRRVLSILVFGYLILMAGILVRGFLGLDGPIVSGLIAGISFLGFLILVILVHSFLFAQTKLTEEMFSFTTDPDDHQQQNSPQMQGFLDADQKNDEFKSLRWTDSWNFPV